MLTRFEHENIIDLKDIICENEVGKLKVSQSVALLGGCVSSTRVPFECLEMFSIGLRA